MIEKRQDRGEGPFEIDCDWCGGGIKNTEADPVCVSIDGESVVCADCRLEELVEGQP